MRRQTHTYVHNVFLGGYVCTPMNPANTLMQTSQHIHSQSAFKERQVSQHTLTQQREYMTKGACICVSVCVCVHICGYVFQKGSGRWTLCVCILCYSTYMAAQFYPEFYTLIPTALILGLGAAPMWSAKCTYLNQVQLSQISIRILNKVFGNGKIYDSRAGHGLIIR